MILLTATLGVTVLLSIYLLVGCDLGLMLCESQAAKGLPSATPFPTRESSVDTENSRVRASWAHINQGSHPLGDRHEHPRSRAGVTRPLDRALVRDAPPLSCRSHDSARIRRA
jgi:hypothetical protein